MVKPGDRVAIRAGTGWRLGTVVSCIPGLRHVGVDCDDGVFCVILLDLVIPIRHASDVKPYTGPSKWREVAKRMCVCGFHAVLHPPTPFAWWPREHYVMLGLCSHFRNAAVGR